MMSWFNKPVQESTRLTPSVSLHLLDLGFEDFHFRYLAKLLYDARFPLLRALDLSKNRFSSRFMRDWSRSFHNYRFQCLEALDISGKAQAYSGWYPGNFTKNSRYCARVLICRRRHDGRRHAALHRVSRECPDAAATLHLA